MTHLFERLIAAHRLLNREIRRERTRAAPDRFRVIRLKKERLAIKDRLFRYFPVASDMRRATRVALVRVRSS